MTLQFIGTTTERGAIDAVLLKGLTERESGDRLDCRQYWKAFHLLARWPYTYIGVTD